MYPVHVVKYSGRAESSSGGKDYHLVRIDTPTGCCIVINRWAKKGQWGSGWSLKTYTTGTMAIRDYEAKFKEKFEGKYREKLIDSSTRCTNILELRKALGPYWAKIGSENLQHIGISKEDAADSRAQQPFEWDEKAGKLKEKPPIPIKEAEPTLEDKIAINPEWGLF